MVQILLKLVLVLVVFVLPYPKQALATPVVSSHPVSIAPHGLGGHVIADGGCTCPGDVAKAFGGAPFCYAWRNAGRSRSRWGTSNYQTLCPMVKQPKLDNGNFMPHYEERKFVQFYGMSLDTANKKHFGGPQDYRPSEGRTVEAFQLVMLKIQSQDILGGLRSTCTYIGAIPKQTPSVLHLSQVSQQYNAYLRVIG